MKFIPDDPCPECGKPLVYKDGPNYTLDEAFLLCPECQAIYGVYWDKVPDDANEEAEWYDELNRGYNQDRI